jgi:puromycin-sensitive aminopeptidase
LAPSFEKGWIKVNAGQSGVFRVAYGSGLSAALNPAIETLSLSPSDRLGLQNDAFALAKAGYIQLSQALTLAKSFTNETDYTVWSDLSANLSYVASVFEGEDFFPKFQNYTRQLYEKIGASLGWDPKAGQTDLDKLLRSVVLAKLGDNGDASVVAEAKKRFEAFKADPNSLPADLRSVVLKFVMRNGGAAEFDEMVNLYKTAQMPEDKINALRAIGLSRDSALIQKALDYILDGEVRNQDAYILIAACASTPVGRKLTWQFVKTNWDVIVQRFSGGMAMVGAFIKFSVDGFATEEAAADVEEFFKTHKADGTERTIAQCIESIKSNAAWLKRNADDIRKFLESNGY